MFPGFERNEERVRQVIAYKRQLHIGLRQLQEDMAALNNFADPDGVAARIPSDAPFSYKHAAELALAINDVPLAVDILTEFVTSDEVLARTLMQICFFALSGAIVGNFAVLLGPNSFVFERDSEPFAVFPWPAESLVAVEVARRILPAAAAAITPFTLDLNEFGNAREASFGKAAVLALQLTDEYQAVARLWDHSLAKLPEVGSSLTELDARFAIGAKQALSRSELHPSIPKGFVDFGLLAIYVGLARQNRFEFLDRRDDLPEVTFIRKVAAQIASITPPFDRGQRRYRGG